MIFRLSYNSSSDTSEGCPEVDSNHTSWLLGLRSAVVGIPLLCLLSSKFDDHLHT